MALGNPFINLPDPFQDAGLIQALANSRQRAQLIRNIRESEANAEAWKEVAFEAQEACQVNYDIIQKLVEHIEKMKNEFTKQTEVLESYCREANMRRAQAIDVLFKATAWEDLAKHLVEDAGIPDEELQSIVDQKVADLKAASPKDAEYIDRYLPGR